MWSKLFLRAGTRSFNGRVFFPEELSFVVDTRDCNVVKDVGAFTEQ